MKRFDDELLVEILTGMREPGGKKLSAEAWAAIERTQVRTASTGSQPSVVLLSRLLPLGILGSSKP